MEGIDRYTPLRLYKRRRSEHVKEQWNNLKLVVDWTVWLYLLVAGLALFRRLVLEHVDEAASLVGRIAAITFNGDGAGSGHADGRRAAFYGGSRHAVPEIPENVDENVNSSRVMPFGCASHDQNSCAISYDGASMVASLCDAHGPYHTACLVDRHCGLRSGAFLTSDPGKIRVLASMD